MEKKKRFPYQYFIVTFAWSWIFWIPAALTGLGIQPADKKILDSLSGPFMLLAMFGPLVGALSCLGKTKGAIGKYLRGLLDLRFGWRVWVIPLFVIYGSTFFSWILPEFWGEPRIPSLLPSPWMFPVVFLAMILIGGGQEELGWRGFILDYLEDRLGPWLGNLVLGVIWTLWHLPLFFIPGTSQYYGPFVSFLLLILGYTGILAWVRRASGKRTMACLFVHGAMNASVQLFTPFVLKFGIPQPRLWIWVSLTLAIGLAMLALRARKTQPEVKLTVL